jgi:hypothetical protein
MTETHLAILGIYLLIGWTLADTFLVKDSNAYWLIFLFYPVMIVLFILTLFVLAVAVKFYELKEWLGNEFRI